MIIWQCSGRYVKKGEIGCDNNHMFYKAFVEAYNAVVENKEDFNEKWEEQIESDYVLKKGNS